MLYFVPIESYDSRYSAQWNRWFPEYLERAEIPHRILWGRHTPPKLTNAGVLDPFDTHLYKFDQLSSIVELLKANKIGNGDVLFFCTLWFTGLDSLQYIRQSLGINFRIVGILHAGSYDPWDFRTRLGMKPWAHHLERAWFTFVDRILVASEYHKKLVVDELGIDEEKLIVTPLPLRLADVRRGRDSVIKENLVAFPHRSVPEKDPGLVERVQSKNPEVTIVRTRECCNTKEEYYDLLSRCKICISNSHQETFGYAMLEAAALGAVPLVPDRLCYTEMYPDEFRFSSEEELVEKIGWFASHWSDPGKQMGPLLHRCDKAVETTIRLALET